ncbi:IclR family transcriptional regulator [Rhodococcus sp. SGAir0479]|nr:IclR family transcriptional regulator [Rhodococcus sp. SGAir0479]
MIERATRVVDAFLSGPARLTLEDVTTVTGLPRSTAFRIVNQLVELQWLAHDAPGYRLGERALWMGTRHGDHTQVRAAAAAHLNHLHLTTGTVVHLAVLEGARVLYLDKVGGSAADSVPSHVGARVAAERTVAGRALLAALPPERVDNLLALEGAGPSTAPALSRLHADLGHVRGRGGLAFSAASESALGIARVAAVVTGPDGPAAAISAAGRGRVSLEAIAPLVALAARRTSRDLLPTRTRAAGRAR